MFTLYKICLFAFVLCGISLAYAEKDQHPGSLSIVAGDKTLKFSGYFDAYYAYDFSDPYRANENLDSGGGRDYTSNPLYDRQFSVDYGFIQTDFENSSIDFRFAYHFGDIVQKMYFDESTAIKPIREASARIDLTPKLSLEAGIMPSIFGFETFINKENMHATRSYMTDFAPDFEAGIRGYYHLAEHQLIKFQVTNGWQVIRDNNKDKALGFAYIYDIPKQFLFNWGIFYGNEATEHRAHSYRHYHNIFSKIFIGDWVFAPVLDLGWEENYRSDGKRHWVPWHSYGFSVRYAINEKHGVAYRLDRTYDPNCIIPELVTNRKHGWQSLGHTTTYEYLWSSHVTFRVEGRFVRSKDAVFKSHKADQYQKEESFLYSSVALAF